jgi:hypothetical protein
VKRRLAREFTVLMSLLALAGCGLHSAGRGVATPLEDGDFRAATLSLREQAARCENGRPGREALLVRAMLELDLRNPAGSPDTAARLAAHYLQLPDATSAGVSAAESLYLLALDRGASAVQEPWRFPGVASRFSRCGAPPPEARLLRELPEHPGTPTLRELNEVHRELYWSQQQADSLKAELARIRKLLGQSGGGTR